MVPSQICFQDEEQILKYLSLWFYTHKSRLLIIKRLLIFAPIRFTRAGQRPE